MGRHTLQKRTGDETRRLFEVPDRHDALNRRNWPDLPTSGGPRVNVNFLVVTGKKGATFPAGKKPG